MTERLPLLSLLAAVLLPLLALGQDSEAVTLPVTVQARSTGELTAYIADGGCMCQPISRVAVAPYPCNGTCGVSRARTRNAVADAVDGGALSQ